MFAAGKFQLPFVLFLESTAQDTGKPSTKRTKLGNNFTKTNLVAAVSKSEGSAQIDLNNSIASSFRPGKLSKAEMLARLFPKQDTAIRKLVLQGCNGDVVKAIEHFLSAEDSLTSTSTESAIITSTSSRTGEHLVSSNQYLDDIDVTCSPSTGNGKTDLPRKTADDEQKLSQLRCCKNETRATKKGFGAQESRIKSIRPVAEDEMSDSILNRVNTFDQRSKQEFLDNDASPRMLLTANSKLSPRNRLEHFDFSFAASHQTSVCRRHDINAECTRTEVDNHMPPKENVPLVNNRANFLPVTRLFDYRAYSHLPSTIYDPLAASNMCLTVPAFLSPIRNNVFRYPLPLNSSHFLPILPRDAKTED